MDRKASWDAAADSDAAMLPLPAQPAGGQGDDFRRAAANERSVAYHLRRMSVSIVQEARQHWGAVVRGNGGRGAHRQSADSDVVASADEIELDAATDVHTTGAAHLVARLATSATDGLASVDAAERLARDGPNEIALPPRHPLRSAVAALFHGFAGILWVAAVQCLLAWRPFGDPNPEPANLALAAIIFVMIFVQAGFTAMQELRSGRIMEELLRVVRTDARSSAAAAASSCRRRTLWAISSSSRLACARAGGRAPARRARSRARPREPHRRE